MVYQKLGYSGTLVSKLCLGTMNFGMVTDEKNSFDIMNYAIENGINFFDTSNSYGGYDNRGLTEKIIGKWFSQEKKRNQVFLADKVYHLTEPVFFNENDNKGLSAYKIRHHIEESLKRLKTDHIDLYQMHHIDNNVNWNEIWSEFNHQYNLGNALYFGSSNFTAYDIAVCNNIAKNRNMMGLVSEQHRYNLLCRLPELEVIPACRKEKIGFIVWGPLSAGRLGNNPFNSMSMTRSSHNNFSDEMILKINKYQELCKKENLLPAELGLAWLLNNPNVMSVIIGPRDLSQLKSCINSLELDVNPYLEVLDDIFTPIGEAPEVYAW